MGTVPITVFYLAAVATALWFVLEHTPFGRYLYALGSNPQAAKLAGIRVMRLRSLSLPALSGPVAGTLTANRYSRASWPTPAARAAG